MSKPPRSPRAIKLLNSLEQIYANTGATAAERLKAAQLAARILGRRKPTPPRKKVKAAPPSPPVSGADLAPAQPVEPPKAADVLRYFERLEKK